MRKGERAPATSLVSCMTTQGYVLYDTHGRCSLNIYCEHFFATGMRGSTEQGLHLTAKAYNEVGLAWLEDAFAYAFAHRRPALWAYLEAVMDEVLFEMELEARL
jgi:hypothetical protein